MLKDSAHIQEFEAEWRNREAKRSNGTLKEVVPLYDMDAAVNVMKQFVGCPYSEKIDLCDGITIETYRCRTSSWFSKPGSLD